MERCDEIIKNLPRKKCKWGNSLLLSFNFLDFSDWAMLWCSDQHLEILLGIHCTIKTREQKPHATKAHLIECCMNGKYHEWGKWGRSGALKISRKRQRQNAKCHISLIASFYSLYFAMTLLVFSEWQKKRNFLKKMGSAPLCPQFLYIIFKNYNEMLLLLCFSLTRIKEQTDTVMIKHIFKQYELIATRNTIAPHRWNWYKTEKCSRKFKVWGKRIRKWTGKHV